MGYTAYSSTDRLLRSASVGYATKTTNEIFTQNVKRVIHESMDPANVTFRECMDSEAHPNTVPVQLYLDVTGSMGRIPHELIKDGLPTMVGTLIQNGVKDVALMFGAVGDHECDRYPLQVAQFESGDAELDMWLTRTYLEGGGGGNSGESYLLAWYFAGNHVKTDAFNKRGKKGYVFTVGDEPNLKTLPMRSIKELLKESAIGQSTWTEEALLAKAQEQNYVYHIHIDHNFNSEYMTRAWKEMMGQNLIIIKDPQDLGRTISDIILVNENLVSNTISFNTADKETSSTEIML